MRNPMKMSSILKPSALIRCEGLMPGDIGYGCTGETDVPPSWSSCPCHICPILKRLWSLSILSTFFNRFPHFHDHATWPVEVATRWHVVYLESFLQLPHGDENWWNTSEALVCIRRLAIFCNILQTIATEFWWFCDWDFVAFVAWKSAISRGISTCAPLAFSTPAPQNNGFVRSCYFYLASWVLLSCGEHE